MKKSSRSLIVIISAVLILAGCASWNKTQKGAVIGTAAGGTMGAVIGRASGNTALGSHYRGCSRRSHRGCNRKSDG